MTKIGVSPDEARHHIGEQGSLTEQIRAHLRTIESHVNNLAFHSYVSATTAAQRAKFEAETKPQFEKILQRAEDAQVGTGKAVGRQLETQDAGASTIMSI